ALPCGRHNRAELSLFVCPLGPSDFWSGKIFVNQLGSVDTPKVHGVCTRSCEEPGSIRGPSCADRQAGRSPFSFFLRRGPMQCMHEVGEGGGRTQIIEFRPASQKREEGRLFSTTRKPGSEINDHGARVFRSQD